MNLLLIGHPAPGRLATVRNVLPHADAEAFESVAALCKQRSRRWFDLIVVFQDWPEQYTAGEVAWLIDAYPLARIVCAYGPFCESDGRTRGIWPHAVRTPQPRLSDRLRRELAVVRGETPPLPLTASRRERFLFEHSEV